MYIHFLCPSYLNITLSFTLNILVGDFRCNTDNTTLLQRRICSIHSKYVLNIKQQLKKTDEAFKYYKMCADNNYGKGAEMYQSMIRVLNVSDKKDEEQILNIIAEGKERFPKDYVLNIEEFNYWKSIPCFMCRVSIVYLFTNSPTNPSQFPSSSCDP